MLPFLTVASAVVAALLIDAGVAKVRAPAATSEALRLARLPDRTALVRLLGAGEVALGASAIVLGGLVPMVLLAAAYGVFAVFAERQRRTGSSCGCFGAKAAPLTRMHVVVDALAAVVAATAGLLAAPSLLAAAGPGVLETLTVVAVVALGAVALRHVLTTLPALTELTDRALEVTDS